MCPYVVHRSRTDLLRQHFHPVTFREIGQQTSCAYRNDGGIGHFSHISHHILVSEGHRKEIILLCKPAYAFHCGHVNIPSFRHEDVAHLVVGKRERIAPFEVLIEFPGVIAV